jgi:hypothetical protein
VAATEVRDGASSTAAAIVVGNPFEGMPVYPSSAVAKTHQNAPRRITTY